MHFKEEDQVLDVLTLILDNKEQIKQNQIIDAMSQFALLQENSSI